VLFVAVPGTLYRALMSSGYRRSAAPVGAHPGVPTPAGAAGAAVPLIWVAIAIINVVYARRP